MVWVNDQRIRDAQLQLIKLGYPTKIRILGRRKFAMIISLKRLRKTVEDNVGKFFEYVIYDATTKNTPVLGIKARGNLAGFDLRTLEPMVAKLEMAGFKTAIKLSEDFSEIDFKISLQPLQDVFTMRGIPKRLFTEKLKVENNNPFLIITFVG